MARVLIVGGGCRGLALTRVLVEAGHAVRVTTRSHAHEPAIVAAGAEPHLGDPNVVGTIRPALDGVAILVWALATATGPAAEIEALMTTRVDMLLTQVLDTTVRGVAFEATGTAPGALLESAASRAREAMDRSHIPHRLLRADPADVAAWVSEADAAIGALLSG